MDDSKELTPLNDDRKRLERVETAAGDINLPGPVRKELLEKMADPDWYAQVARMQLELRVDETTGLMVEKAFEYFIRNELASINRVIDEVYTLTINRQPNSEQDKEAIATEVMEKFRPELTEIGLQYEMARLADLSSKNASVTAEQRINIIQEAYVLSELSKMMIIAGDFQKLKACNDFGASQRPDMDGEQYVDEFGFKIWGRRMQALSVLTNSTDYQESLRALDGTTEKDRLDVSARVKVGSKFYLEQVEKLVGAEDLQYLRDRQIKIIPGRREKSGDEAIFLVKGANELTEEDAQVVDRVIKKASHIDIGKFDKAQKANKVAIAVRILGGRCVLRVEDDLEASLDLRIGGVKMSEIYPKIMIEVYDAAEVDDRLKDPEYINQQATKRMITEAKRDMEEKKKQETLDTIYNAINGSKQAQLDMVLLIEQNRFAYRSELLTEALASYPVDQPISREDFDTWIVPKITSERRSATQ
jgi:hypothetical protein